MSNCIYCYKKLDEIEIATHQLLCLTCAAMVGDSDPYDPDYEDLVDDD